MEDFYYAGGLPVVLRELLENNLLNKGAMTANGITIGENNDRAECHNREVIYPFSKPLKDHAGIAVLTGNLAPNGAVIKPSAATAALMTHKGKAVVFESIEDFKARIDLPTLQVDRNSILVLKGAGPRGYPGMPEVGNMPLPKKLLEQGVRDMVRISDARMSGTAYGTVVLHVSPESAAGGPLALVRNGDEIELDVSKRKLHLCVSDKELQARRTTWKPEPVPEKYKRGYAHLYIKHVMQSDKGADFDFLVGASGAGIPRESH
jgi:dihydroxy-acid dehydratase